MENDSLQILLDSQTATYNAGDTLYGQVKLLLKSEKLVRAISVEFLGEANTSWTLDERKVKTLIDNVAKAHQEFFNENKFLHNNSNSGGNETFAAGPHLFPFEFTLPMKIPTSFESDLGHIRYIIRASVNWKNGTWTKYKVKTLLHVIVPVELSKYFKEKGQTKIQREQRFSCLCNTNKSKMLHVIITIPSNGFAPEDTIPISLKVINNCYAQIEDIKFSFERVEMFLAKNHERKRFRDFVIVSGSMGLVEANTTIQVNHMLKLPKLEPTNVYCDILKIYYELRFFFDVPGSHDPFEVKIPIFIGLKESKKPKPLPSVSRRPNTLKNKTIKNKNETVFNRNSFYRELNTDCNDAAKQNNNATKRDNNIENGLLHRNSNDSGDSSIKQTNDSLIEEEGSNNSIINQNNIENPVNTKNITVLNEDNKESKVEKNGKEFHPTNQVDDNKRKCCSCCTCPPCCHQHSKLIVAIVSMVILVVLAITGVTALFLYLFLWKTN